MDYTWIHIIKNPNDFGISTFVSAILFSLSLYHFILYFQVKNKVYWLYALYTFIVFIYTYYREDSFFLAELSQPIIPYIENLSDTIKWVYTTVYLYFALVFIELHKFFPRWYNFYFKTIIISFFMIVILTVWAIIRDNYVILEYAYNYFYLPIIFVLGLYLLYLIARTPGRIKYYLLIGSGVYLVVTTYSHILTYTGHPFRILFYFSIVFESVFFALGLGAKQKQLMEERNNIQAEIISEHEKYLQLQERIQHKLDQEIHEKTREILQLEEAKAKEERLKWEIELNRQTLELRMRALQTQMNPHFLFNSLNSIKHFIITNKKEEAVYFLGKLSRLIRMILDSSGKKSISISEELEILRLYVEVENIRLHQSVNLQIDLSEKLNPQTVFLPPIVLQPFIENAIWHGLSTVQGEKIINVKIFTEGEMLFIHITDNGIGRKKAAQRARSKIRKKEALGIDLTLERLKMFSHAKKGDAHVHFEDIMQNNTVAGTRVVISLPLV